FAERDLVFKTPSRQDGRQVLLSLTTKGRLAFASIDERSQGDVAGMLEKIPVPEQERVVGAMGAIERLIGGQVDEPDAARPAYVLRPPRAGDMGWIVARHGALY